MIRIGNKSVIAIYRGTTPINRVYTHAQLVWPEGADIMSCFAAGYWIDEYPWTDELSWTD